MKVFHKLSLGLLIIVLIVGIFGFATIKASQNVLQNSIVEKSILLTGETLSRIERRISNRIEYLQALSKEAAVRDFLKHSNLEYETLAGVQAYIDEQDKAWVSAAKTAVTSFMQALIDNPLSATIRERLELFNQNYNYEVFGEVFLTNRFGANAAQTGKTSDFYQADEEWWQSARETGLYIGDVEFDESAQIYSLDIGIAIQDDQGNFLGAMKSVLNIRDAFDVLKEQTYLDVSPAKVNDVHLIDKTGAVIYSTEDITHIRQESEALWSAVSAGGGTGHLFEQGYKGKKERKLFVYAHSKGYKALKDMGWAFIMEYDPRDIFISVARMRDMILLFLAGILAIGSGAGFLITRSISGSIVQLQRGAQEIGKGNLDVAIDSRSKDEIGFLSRTFNQMVLDLKSQRNQLVDRDFLDAIIGNMLEALIVIDAKGVIKRVNNSVLSMVGYTEEELIGQSVFKIFEGGERHGGDIYRQPLLTGLLEYGLIHNRQAKMLTKGGAPVPVNFSASVLRVEGVNQGPSADWKGWPHGMDIVIVARNMEEVNRLIRSLEESRAQLAETNIGLEKAKAEVEKFSESLEQRVRERSAQLETLYEISNAVAVTTNTQQLMSLALAALFKIIDYDIGVSVLRDEHGVYVLVRPSFEESVKFIDTVKDAALKSLAAFTDEHTGGRQIYTTVLPIDPQVRPKGVREFSGIKSSFNVPLVGSQGKITGMLDISSTQENFFHEEDFKFIYTIANQISGSIERLRARLMAERSKMDSMFQSIQEGVIMLDSSGEVVVMNPRARAMMGIADRGESFHQALGERMRLVGLDHAVNEARQKETVVQKEIVLPENPKQVLLCNISPVRSGNVMEGAAIIIRDISKEKEIDEMKTEFISTVSHELRTPLSIIKEGLSLLLDKVAGETNAKQQKILMTAGDNINRLSRLINNLLDISKIEAGKMEFHKQKLDLVELANRVMADFEIKAREKKLKLNVSFPEAKVEVFADRDKLIQVLTNLINNAMKFTPQGHIELSGKTIGGLVECTVADTGIGISAANLKSTFQRFQQFGRVHGSGERGTGLGLSIAKGIVEMHGGTIRVESVLGQGTKFIFTLPKFSPELPLKEFVQNGIGEAQKSASHMSLVMVDVTPAGEKKSLPEERENGYLSELEKLLKRDLHREGDATFRDDRRCAVILANCDKKHAVDVCGRIKGTLNGYLASQKLTGKVSLEVAYATYPDDARSGDDLLKKVKKI